MSIRIQRLFDTRQFSFGLRFKTTTKKCIYAFLKFYSLLFIFTEVVFKIDYRSIELSTEVLVRVWIHLHWFLNYICSKRGWMWIFSAMIWMLFSFYLYFTKVYKNKDKKIKTTKNHPYTSYFLAKLYCNWGIYHRIVGSQVPFTLQ